MGKAHSSGWSRAGTFFDSPAEIVQKVLCGRDEAWTRASADRFGWEEVETSWQRLVERDDIDIIDIAAPSDTHKEIALAAIARGKHVFCEKPLALSAADAAEMTEAAKKAGVKAQVGFNYRFCPAVALAKKLVDEGKLGEIYHFRGRFLQDFLIDPSFPLVWRLDKKVAGSGAHGDLGAHVIDAARYLVGEFSRVIGTGRRFIGERPIVERMEGLSATSAAGAPLGKVTVDDATAFLGEFQNGAMCVIEATRFATGYKNDMGFTINGSKGAIRFDFERMNELGYYSVGDEAGLQGFRTIQCTEGLHPYMSGWWPVGHVLGYDVTFVHEMLEFVRAIAEDRPTSPDFEDGLACCRVLEAVDRSIEEERWISI